MQNLKENEIQFWNEYFETLQEKPKNPYVEAEMPGDENCADDLLKLYLDGKKSAGSTILKSYEFEGARLPEVGEYWMILDSKRQPKCIGKIVKVETNRFDEVPERIAIAEGEGDLSLTYWRKVHKDFWKSEVEKLGISDLDTEQILTEHLEIVFRT